MKNQILLVLVFACLLIGLVMVVLASRMSKRLWNAVEVDHPETWRELGEPRTGAMMPSKNRRLRRFVRNRDYLALDDSEVTRMAQRLARLGYVTEGVFWAAVGLVIYLAMTST